MRIKSFNLLADSAAEHYNLKNCPVVIDGFNYFYNLHKISGLSFAFGCECDKLANYVRDHLSTFQKANVTCYFIFKGGIDNVQANMNKHVERPNTKEYDPKKQEEVFEPIFNQDVYKQVLKEIGIKYTVCKMEAKKQCIALARDLNCPIISYDIEFCFSNVPYISSKSLSLNKTNGGIKCRIFRLNRFLDKYSLTKEMLVPFILLRDEKMYPEGTFEDFFRRSNIPWSYYRRNVCLLKWLSKQPTRKNVMNIIFRFIRIISSDAYKAFVEKEIEAQSYVDPQIDIGVPAKYLKDDNYENETDEDWLEYAIASGRIPGPYINLYTDNIFKYSRAIQDPDSGNALFSTIDVIKFAYTLLTNEENDKFLVYSDDGDSYTIHVDRSRWTSEIKLNRSLLINGLENVAIDKLFGCFSQKRFDTILEDVPDNAKLLLIALICCADKSEHFTNTELFSIILCYFTLSVASEICSEDSVAITPGKIPKFNPTERFGISSTDSLNATAVLSKYFEITDSELTKIFNRKILHPLVEFQYCLQHVNFLNKLCGAPYKTTEYSKTYNGTFIYRILYEIKKNYNDNYMDFLCSNLKCAPGIVNFVLSMMNYWQEYLAKN